MSLQPRSTDEIYDSIRSRLGSAIDKISNFVSGSFNEAWTRSYSVQIREAELKALAGELAGYVDYAGKDLTKDDLDRLGVEGVEPAEINQYMDDDQLDNLGANLGVERDPGERATGTATFEVLDDTVEIEEGMEVGTEPDSRGNYRSFYVDADGDGEITESSTASVTPDSGETTVTVDVIAAEVGTEYNGGTGYIEYIPNPKPGVHSVTNNVEITGGEDEQTNESLREDIKNAIFESSSGGTRMGISSYIQEHNNDVGSVGIDEYLTDDPPFVDVVVEGGDATEIEGLIEEARPVGVQHYLVRPTDISIGVYSQLIGSDIDPTYIQDQISSHLITLAVGDRFSRSSLLQDIITADNEIESAPALTTYITNIDSERYEYSSNQDVYELVYGPLGDIYEEEHLFEDGKYDYALEFEGFDSSSVTVEAIVSNERQELVSGTDYTVEDTNGDGQNDTIRLTEETIPDSSTVMEISYRHNNASVDAVYDVQDGTEYTEGDDYTVVDADGDGLLDSIDWSGGTSTPADGDRFGVDYRPFRSFEGDIRIDERQMFSPESSRIEVTTYNE